MGSGMNEVFTALDSIRAANPLFRNEVLVLEQNENSELVGTANPASRVFFERVFAFDGPFWDVLSETGFAVRPSEGKYAVFVGNQLFFVKNFENRFFVTPGLSKRFVVERGRAVPKRVFSFSSVLDAASFPRDFLGQSVGKVKTAFLINEAVAGYATERNAAFSYWEKNRAPFDDPVSKAAEALSHAVRLMRYSFLASLGYSLSLSAPLLTLKDAWVDSLFALSKDPPKNRGRLTEEFGFFAQNPYDLSSQRLSESFARSFAVSVPSNALLRWREENKLLCGCYLDVCRQALRQIGTETDLGDDVFFLEWPELSIRVSAELKRLAARRRSESAAFSALSLPQQVFFDGRWSVDPDARVAEKTTGPSAEKEDAVFVLKGVSVGGQGSVCGKAVRVESERDLTKPLSGAIAVSDSLWPDLTLAYSQLRGVVSKTGGNLSHAAIVAREYGLTCIAQVSDFDRIAEGDWLELDGKTGSVRVSKKRPVSASKPQKRLKRLGHE
jgi:phosphohistidine swiveling domain-containing protein